MPKSETPERLTVNQALDELPRLVGQTVTVRGLLNYKFEGTYLEHYPKAGRMTDEYPGPKIWIDPGYGSIAFNDTVMTGWHGKRVEATGIIFGPASGFEGCGHLGGCVAEMIVSGIDRIKD